MKTIFLSFLLLFFFQISFGQDSLLCNNYSVYCNDPDALDEDYFEIFEIDAAPEMPLIISNSYFPDSSNVSSNLWIPFNVEECFKKGAILKDLSINIQILGIRSEELQIKLHLPSSLSSYGVPEAHVIDSLGNVGGYHNTYDAFSSAALFSLTRDYTIESDSLNSISTVDFSTENTGNGLPYSYGKTWYIQIQNFDSSMCGFSCGSVRAAKIELTVAYPKPYFLDSETTFLELQSEVLVEATCNNNAYSNSEIHRSYAATDENGNYHVCQQIVELIPTSLDNLNIPDDLTIECSQGIDPSDIQLEPLGQFYSCWAYEDSDFEFCDLIVSWEDVLSENCSAFKIIRNWTFTKFCEGTSRSYVQIIEVLDTKAPKIEWSTISIPTDTFSCTGSVSIDNLNIIDECSDVILVEGKVLISGDPDLGSAEYLYIDLLNGGSLEGLELGANVIELRLEDSCLNADTLDLMINVFDNTSPTALCNQEQMFSLNPHGLGRIYATDIDALSTDNCADLTLELRRTSDISAPWRSFVDFDFCDQGILDIELRATDDAGNSAVCNTEVEILNLDENLQCLDYSVYCNDPDVLNENYYEVYKIAAAPEMPGNIAGIYGDDTGLLASNLWIPCNVAECFKKGTILNDIRIKVQLTHNEITDVQIKLHVPFTLRQLGIPSEIVLAPLKYVGSSNLFETTSVEALYSLVLDYGIPADYLNSAIHVDFFTENTGTAKPSTLGETWYIQIEDYGADRGGFESGGQLTAVQIDLIVGFPKPALGLECPATLVEELVIESSCDNTNFSNAEIHRTYSYTNDNGNIKTCQQIVSLLPPILDDLNMPDDITLECSDGIIPSDFQFQTIGQVFACWDYEESNFDYCNFVITWEDIVEENCSAFILLREWTFTNLCEGTTRSHMQKIEVLDTEAPKIELGSSTISTDANSCSGTAYLGNLDIIDECSEIITIEAKYLIAGNPYLGNAEYAIVDILNGERLEDLGLGANIAELRLEDSCHNADTFNLTINVIDNTNPEVFCKQDHVILLNADGVGRLYATDFDANSTDNCGTVNLEIRNQGCVGIGWGEYMDVAFCDVGFLDVELRATDAAGNTNICSSTIEVTSLFLEDIECHDYEVCCSDPEALNSNYKNSFTIEAAPDMPGNVASGFDSIPRNLWIPFNVEFCPSKGALLKNIEINVNGIFRRVSEIAIYLHIPTSIVEKYNIPQTLILDKKGEVGSANNYTPDNQGYLTDLLLLFEPKAIESIDLTSQVMEDHFTENIGTELPKQYGKTWYIQIENNEIKNDALTDASELTSASIQFETGFPTPDLNSNISAKLVKELLIESSCESPAWQNAYLFRQYEFINSLGIRDTCEQHVNILPTFLEDLKMPDDITVNCSLSSDSIEIDFVDLGQFFGCWGLSEESLELCSLNVVWDDNWHNHECIEILSRKWTFVSLCSGEVKTYVQTITAEDNSPPYMTGLDQEFDAVVISTNESNCTGTLSLKNLGVFDDCSSGSKAILKHLVSGNPYLGNAVYKEVDLLAGQTLDSLEIGEHIVTLELSDNCQNKDTIDFTILVLDRTLPLLNCKDRIKKYLDENGKTTLAIEELNLNYSDNCGEPIVEMRSLGCNSNEWATTLEFNSCDIGVSDLEIRATDEAGNVTLCTSKIAIIDRYKTSPENDQEYQEEGIGGDDLSGFSNEDDLEFKKFPNLPENQFEIYPNPFSESCFISFFSDSNRRAQIAVYNSLGQRVFERVINSKKGYNKFEIQKEELGVTGHFFLVLRSNELQQIQKLILINN